MLQYFGVFKEQKQIPLNCTLRDEAVYRNLPTETAVLILAWEIIQEFKCKYLKIILSHQVTSQQKNNTDPASRIYLNFEGFYKTWVAGEKEYLKNNIWEY